MMKYHMQPLSIIVFIFDGIFSHVADTRWYISGYVINFGR